VLLTLMGITAFTVVWLRNLFAAVMLLGIFSLLSAALYVNLDAVDVAFTEAAVGAGISTVLMLGTLALTQEREKAPRRSQVLPLAVVLLTGAALIYGTFDMPPFGDPDAPIHHHVAPRYLERSGEEVGLPNVVTSVLASYRGYDTLGETTVIFTAGIGVLTLLGRGRRARRRRGGEGGEK
jgi:multicomponent Na+:H+ antiporter subunit B